MSNTMSRREFLKLTGTVTLGAAALTIGGASAEKKPSSTRSMKLPQRILGRTGESVSILGVGGVGMITDTDDIDAIVAMLNEAVDRGVTYFDTAPDYGNGKSETRLGMMVAKRRKEIFLATKVNERTYDAGMKQIEESMKRLQTDHVDLIQLHYWPNRQNANMDPFLQIGEKDGVLRALYKLKDEKVIGAMGLTGHPNTAFNMRDDMRRAIAHYDFDTVLSFINPSNQSLWVNRELIPIAKRKNMGIIGMKAFGGGTPGAIVGKSKGKVPASELLRYAFSQPIHVTIPSVANIDQMRHNVEIAKTFKPISAAESKVMIEKLKGYGVI